MNPAAQIAWRMSGAEVERESFRRIEAEMPAHPFTPSQWPVVRRLIHATADFSLAADLHFAHDPIAATLAAVRAGARIYCDSNMIRGGVSLARLRALNPAYTRDHLCCLIDDPAVARLAAERGCTRALAALETARDLLPGAIVLIGNAPLALAGLVRLHAEAGLRPAVVIGMPVGFVHVLESKEMLMRTDLPQLVLKGRRGGSPLAVAAFHGILENA
ncbi:MAG: precorrin-8X methylmutase [Lentisphaeria bacterium]|jgi:cobalt/nickel transport system ATP-binding protein/precorrin-8X/cobalt-precorrin-8 methylmutase